MIMWELEFYFGVCVSNLACLDVLYHITSQYHGIVN